MQVLLPGLGTTWLSPFIGPEQGPGILPSVRPAALSPDRTPAV